MVFTEGLIGELASGRYTCECIRPWYREFPFRPYRLLHNKQRRLHLWIWLVACFRVITVRQVATII